jgi:hypothetical protein
VSARPGLLLCLLCIAQKPPFTDIVQCNKRPGASTPGF